MQHKCPVSSCELVYDHRNLATADAVVFHLLDFTNTSDLPQERPTGQSWVVVTLEAPPIAAMHPVDYGRLRGVINWTMSYRRDSEIVVPYGRTVPKELLDTKINEQESLESRDFWSEKTSGHYVAWMVSHCATDSRREWYVKELAKYIKVDVFGKCGFKKCGKNISIKTIGSFDQDSCNDITSKYFFYLSFENSICEDYVTEKLFMPLQLGVVPVVLGGADYNAIAPPESFVNALDFPTPEKLAQALLSIAANRTLYNRFFKWREHYSVQLGHPFDPMICDLCARLHGLPQQHERIQKTQGAVPGLVSRTLTPKWPNGTYRDLEDWFVLGSSCRRWWADAEDYRRHHNNLVNTPGLARQYSEEKIFGGLV
ncbi:alpha-(1,3)-fucosyltransferase 7-like [Hyalella azteca]|uniref:Fucosyltransferase n=1 Tax=Hyalella azteca TaxID=294128 RepID=A0A979FSS8_HYAAZ|nr:alpha-(1,3)-fucosyltransferase 7-like [Hyalella azteca]